MSRVNYNLAGLRKEFILEFGEIGIITVPRAFENCYSRCFVFINSNRR